MQKEEIYSLAKKIWDYHLLHQPLDKADVIVALGSHDIRVADRAAELYFNGFATLIVFSGKRGVLTPKDWQSEAEEFEKRALELSLPKEAIFLEKEAGNTGDNILFSIKLLEEKEIRHDKIIFVQKPFMERRTFATVKKLLPDQDFVVTSPQISFEDYPNETLSKNYIVHTMVGDLQRIKEYPKRGFQIEQEIPDDVWEAYEKLVKEGYKGHLIRS